MGTCASPIAHRVKGCEHLPELPSIQGWVEAMTSLGRLIFFDQPGTGASDPITLGELPTLEQWADSITAVLDDLGSTEAVLLACGVAFAPAALFAATHPSRTTALVVLDGYADARGTPLVQDETKVAMVGAWGYRSIFTVLLVAIVASLLTLVPIRMTTQPAPIYSRGQKPAVETAGKGRTG